MNNDYFSCDFQLKVLAKDVQLCADVATGVDSLGQYQYGDLVQLDQQTVGVIVRLEKEHLQVLNMHGKVVRVKHQGIHGKKDSRFAVALDSDSNNIMVQDMVKVVDGPHSVYLFLFSYKYALRLQGRQGEIKHLYRSFVFVYSRLYPENGGVFVCRARHILLAGAGKNSESRGNNNIAAMLEFTIYLLRW